MAFTTGQQVLTLTENTVYTCPENTTAVMIGGFLANKSELSSAYVTLKYKNPSGVTTELIPGSVLPVISSYAFECKQVIEAGGSIIGKTDSATSGKVDATLSVLTIAG